MHIDLSLRASRCERQQEAHDRPRTAYQTIFKKKWGETTKLADLDGSDVIGTLVNAPLSVYTQGIRVLPMESIKPTKGTGVVTNVPSDSPDDYATITDLAKKADFYGIKKEWASLEILPILSTPSYGDISAKFLVEKLRRPGNVNMSQAFS